MTQKQAQRQHRTRKAEEPEVQAVVRNKVLLATEKLLAEIDRCLAWDE